MDYNLHPPEQDWCPECDHYEHTESCEELVRIDDSDRYIECGCAYDNWCCDAGPRGSHTRCWKEE